MTAAQTTFVDGSPTKEFFVEMLTRDVPLDIAILDLVDNSIDGAKRLRGQDAFDDLEVDIQFGQGHFSITDNCGGIPFELAKNYAFRFGRPKDTPALKHSVGRFGVGMKRALFKIGAEFTVSTRSELESYNIVVKVSEWASPEHPDWDFPVVGYQPFDKPLQEQDRGTTISVSKLTEEAQRQFNLSYFESGLQTTIARRHQTQIDQGLIIRLNDVAIPSTDIRFLFSLAPNLFPSFVQTHNNGVTVRVIAGIGESSPLEAGWYVYCNGRMVLDADRNRVTGWGEPKMMPRFHNQYARFRGAAFFDSDDATLLPWNTTKNGVDEGMPIFAETRRVMITAMRPVVRFLDLLDKELDERPEGERGLTDLVEGAVLKPIIDLPWSDLFKYERPTDLPPPPERQLNILYKRPHVLVEAVKKSLRVRTARAAGELTFDYYVEQENVVAE